MKTCATRLRPTHPLDRRNSAAVLFLLLLGCAARSLGAEPCCEPPRGAASRECKPRGTLFQWSYGTSFSGGPNLDEPLVTDRPDFTEASVTVGRGVLQLESGYTYSFDDDGTNRTSGHSYPETLFRYGVFADWFELRFAPNFAAESIGPQRTSGAEDLYLGLKIGLTPQEGYCSVQAKFLDRVASISLVPCRL